MIDLKNLSNMSEREIWLLWVLAFIAGLSIGAAFF